MRSDDQLTTTLCRTGRGCSVAACQNGKCRVTGECAEREQLADHYARADLFARTNRQAHAQD